MKKSFTLLLYIHIYIYIYIYLLYYCSALRVTQHDSFTLCSSSDSDALGTSGCHSRAQRQNAAGLVSQLQRMRNECDDVGKIDTNLSMMWCRSISYSDIFSIVYYILLFYMTCDVWISLAWYGLD